MTKTKVGAPVDPITIIEETILNRPLALIRMLKRCVGSEEPFTKNELDSYSLATELIEKEIVELQRWFENGQLVYHDVPA